MVEPLRACHGQGRVASSGSDRQSHTRHCLAAIGPPRHPQIPYFLDQHGHSCPTGASGLLPCARALRHGGTSLRKKGWSSPTRVHVFFSLNSSPQQSERGLRGTAATPPTVSAGQPCSRPDDAPIRGDLAGACSTAMHVAAPSCRRRRRCCRCCLTLPLAPHHRHRFDRLAQTLLVGS